MSFGQVRVVRAKPFPSTWLIADRPFARFGMDYESCRNMTLFLPRWGAMSAASGTPKPSHKRSSPRNPPRPHLHQRHRARPAQSRHQERRQARQGTRPVHGGTLQGSGRVREKSNNSRRSRREEAQTEKAKKSQRLVTSAATSLREDVGRI